MHMFNTAVIPYISLDHYLNSNLYTIPNMQNMRFFCYSVYIKIEFKTSLDVSNKKEHSRYMTSSAYVPSRATFPGHIHIFKGTKSSIQYRVIIGIIGYMYPR